MQTENDIRNIIQYVKGFKGFCASVTEKTLEHHENLIVRGATFYRKNEILVIEFKDFNLVIKDALHCFYGNPTATDLYIMHPDNSVSVIRIEGLAGTIYEFLDAFVPKSYKPGFSC